MLLANSPPANATATRIFSGHQAATISIAAATTAMLMRMTFARKITFEGDDMAAISPGARMPHSAWPRA